MHSFRKIGFFLYASNLIIAFAGAALTYGIVKRFVLEHAILYATINFCLIFAVYTLQRLVDHAGFTDAEITVWGHSKRIPVLLSSALIVVAIGLGIPIFSVTIHQITCIAFFSLICLWYTVPLLGKKLREIPGIKIVVIALTWAYACAYFPMKNEGLVSMHELREFSSLLLVYLIAVILPFDIRDVHVDSHHQSTLPQLIGIRSTKALGVVLLITFAVLSIHLSFIDERNYLFYSVILLQIFLLMFTNERRSFSYFLLIDLGIAFLGFSYLY